MFIETSLPRVPGDAAKLESKQFPPTKGLGKCLRFWYHMYGWGTGRLNVYIKKNNVLGAPVWSESGNQGKDWHRAFVPIKSPLNWKVCSKNLMSLSK